MKINKIIYQLLVLVLLSQVLSKRFSRKEIDKETTQQNDGKKWNPYTVAEKFNDIENETYKYMYFGESDDDVEDLTESYKKYFQVALNHSHQIYLFVVNEVEDEEEIETFMEEYYANVTVASFNESNGLFALYVKKSNKTSIKIGENVNISSSQFEYIASHSAYHFENTTSDKAYLYIIQNIMYVLYYNTLDAKTLADALALDVSQENDRTLTDPFQVFTPLQQESLKNQLMAYFEDSISIYFLVTYEGTGENLTAYFEEFKTEFYKSIDEEQKNKTILLLEDTNIFYGGIVYDCGYDIPEEITSKIEEICETASYTVFRHSYFSARYVLRNLIIQFEQPEKTTVTEYIEYFNKYESASAILDNTMMVEKDVLDEFSNLISSFGTEYKIFIFLIHQQEEDNFLEDFLDKYFEAKPTSVVNLNKTIFIKLNEDYHDISAEFYAGEEINMYLDYVRIYDLIYYIQNKKVAYWISKYYYSDAVSMLMNTVYNLAYPAINGWSIENLEYIMQNLYSYPESKAFFKGGELEVKEHFRLRAINEIIAYGTDGLKGYFVFGLNKLANSSQTALEFAEEIQTNLEQLTITSTNNSVIIVLNLEDSSNIDIGIAYGEETGLDDDFVQTVVTAAKAKTTRYDQYHYLSDQMRQKLIKYWTAESLFKYYTNTQPNPLVTPTVSGHFLDPNAYAYLYRYITEIFEHYFYDVYVKGIYYDVFIIDKVDDNVTDISSDMMEYLWQYGEEDLKKNQFLAIYEVENDKLTYYIGSNLEITADQLKSIFSYSIDNYFASESYYLGFKLIARSTKYKLVPPYQDVLAYDLKDELSDGNYLAFDPSLVISQDQIQRIQSSFLSKIYNNSDLPTHMYYTILDDVDLYDTESSINDYFTNYVTSLNTDNALPTDNIISLVVKKKNACLYQVASTVEAEFNVSSTMSTACEEVLKLLDRETLESVRYLPRMTKLKISDSDGMTVDSLVTNFQENNYTSTPFVDVYDMYDEDEEEDHNNLLLNLKENHEFDVFLITIYSQDETSLTEDKNFLESFYAKILDNQGETTFDTKKNLFLLYIESEKLLQIVPGSGLSDLLTSTLITEISNNFQEKMNRGAPFKLESINLIKEVSKFTQMKAGIWSPELLNFYAKTYHADDDYIVYSADLSSEVIEKYEKQFAEMSEKNISMYFFELQKFEDETISEEKFLSDLMNNFYTLEKYKYIDNAAFMLVNKKNKKVAVATGMSHPAKAHKAGEFIKQKLENDYFPDSLFEEGYNYTMPHFIKSLSDIWTPEVFGFYLYASSYFDYDYWYSEIEETEEPENLAYDYDLYFKKLSEKSATTYMILFEKATETSLDEFIKDALAEYVEQDPSASFNDKMLLLMSGSDKKITLKIGSDHASDFTEEELNSLISKFQTDLQTEGYNYATAIKNFLTTMTLKYVFSNNKVISPDELIKFYNTVMLNDNKCFIFDLFSILDINKRALVDEKLAKIGDNDVNTYIFLLPSMKQDYTAENYLTKLARQFFESLVSRNALENSILVFGSEEEKELKFKTTSGGSEYLNENAINYILDKVEEGEYSKMDDILAKMSDLLVEIATLKKTIDPFELAARVKRSLTPETKYIFFDQYVIMNHTQREELEETYLTKLEDKKTYIAMLMIKDVDSLSPDVEKYLEMVVDELSLPLDESKESRIYILYTDNNKTLNIQAQGKLQSKYTTKKIKSITEKALSNLKEGNYFEGFEELFKQVKATTNSSKSVSTGIIILAIIAALIVIFILVFFVYRLISRRVKTEKVDKDKMLIASVATDNIGKTGEEAQQMDF